jgi:type IV pilus assembly protein PilB
MEKQGTVNFKEQLDAMFSEYKGASSPIGKAAPVPAAATAPHAAAVPHAAPAQPRPENRTVLVVDDNKDYRELVKHLLLVNHYTVLEAGNGEEAMAVVNRHLPDLMLVDFNMPKMNGYELIQEVRSNYDMRGVRIIMFTGATNRQHLRTLNMDISDFLEKPVSNAKLLESVARAFSPLRAGAPAPRSEQPAQQAVPERRALPPQAEPPRPFSTAEIEIERFDTLARGVKSAPGEDPWANTLRASPLPHEPPKPVELPKEALEPPLPEPVPEPPQAAALPEPVPAEEEVPEIEDVFNSDTKDLELIDAAAEKKEEAQENSGLENITHDSPLIQMVNKILLRAVELRASDIHIEPGETKVAVRVRVDGVLRNLTTLPISIQSRLAARIKIMSSLVITERRLPQDGQFRVQIKGSKIEFRVSTLPCIKGEKIVMRILGQSKLNSDLTSLKMSERDLHCVDTALRSPNGLILVTGPTGSGKTTTLYTMINVLNKPDVNIMTAEDPVEYEVPNVNQVKIRPAVGLTFESTLRAFLRQDPDIMLVGEIRDAETGEIAIKASITGHLVFSTLHTNSAPGTVVRLTHMGVAPYLVAASVKLVIAQRLVRTLCPNCRRPSKISEEDAKFLTREELSRLKTVYQPGACSHCHNTGYSGRRPLFEVMPVESAEMRQLITTSNDSDKLSALAAKEGMTTLRQAALEAVAQGSTSMQEALKIMLG